MYSIHFIKSMFGNENDENDRKFLVTLYLVIEDFILHDVTFFLSILHVIKKVVKKRFVSYYKILDYI